MRRSWLVYLTVGLLVLIGSMAVAAPLLRSRPSRPPDAVHAQIVGVSGALSGSAATGPARPRRGAAGPMAWFAWTPEQTGLAEVLWTVPPSGPVTVHIFTGRAPGHLVEVGRSVAGGGAVLATVDAVAGQTLHLEVLGAGRFHLRILQPLAGVAPTGVPAPATVSPSATGARPVPAPASTPPITQALAGDLSGALRTVATTGAATIEGSLANGVAGRPVHYTLRVPQGASGRLRVTLDRVIPAGAGVALVIGGSAPGGAGHALNLDLQPGRTLGFDVRGMAASYRLRLESVRRIRLDVTPPRIVCHRPMGWLGDNRGVRCQATDHGSGLAAPRQRSFALETAIGVGLASADAATRSATVCDRAGNCATVGPFTGLRVDRTSPRVSCEPARPGHWQAAVTVNCRASASAGSSGLASARDASFTLTATLPAGRVSRHARFGTHAAVCNRAGRCSPVPAPARVWIDRRAPRVICAAPPRRWVAALSVACRAVDGEAGLLTSKDARFSLTVDALAGASSPRAYTGVHSVCDQAGNCTVADPIGPIRLDRQAPVVNCRVSASWVRGHIGRVACLAHDLGAGLGRGTPAGFVLLGRIAPGTEATVQTATRRACDRLGNCQTVGPDTVRLDDRAPQISCSPPPRGWQPGPVSVGCTASDAGAGLARGARPVTLVAVLPAGRAGLVRFPRRRFCDAVGNCALSPQLAAVRIDRQPPRVHCRTLPRERDRGNLEVACVASDGQGAGLADPRHARFVLGTSVPAGRALAAAATSSREVCDLAGNCTRVGPFIGRVDRRG